MPGVVYTWTQHFMFLIVSQLGKTNCSYFISNVSFSDSLKSVKLVFNQRPSGDPTGYSLVTKSGQQEVLK